MLLARLDNSIIGRLLGRTLYSGNGNILLSAGTLLTANYIEKLKILGYQRIYILDGENDDIEVEDTVSSVTRSKALSVIAGLAGVAGGDSDLSKRLTMTPLEQVIDSITADVMHAPLTIAVCADLKSFDEYTFQHSVNTCVVCLQLGRKAGLSKDKLRDLGYGALLHDVGKLHLPVELINKPGKLTPEEFEQIKTHSMLGWESLKSLKSLGAVARSGALQHHERFDGKGYPKGLNGLDICWVGRYVAVADVFDALTSDRPYRKAVPNYTVLKENLALGNSGFDPNILNLLHKIACPYPPGTVVRLSDDSRAIVTKVNEAHPAKPLIRILDGKNVNVLLDMADEKRISIVGPATLETVVV